MQKQFWFGKMAAALMLSGTAMGAAAPQASAVPITYTEQAMAFGALGSVRFLSGATLLLTMNNDTTNVTREGNIFSNIGTATVSINDGLPATFLHPVTVFSNNSGGNSGVGFLDGLDILDTGSAAFATYDLTTPIGPITGSPGINALFGYDTSAGGLILSGAGDPTFTATIGAVPEPGSLTIFVSALVGLGVLLRRGRHARS